MNFVQLFQQQNRIFFQNLKTLLVWQSQIAHLYVLTSLIFTFQLISVFSDYLINSINTDKTLGLFQCYLREVAKYQCILEVNTNNILANLITQLQDLWALILNSISILIDILSLLLSLRLPFPTNTPTPKTSSYCSKLNVFLYKVQQ